MLLVTVCGSLMNKRAHFDLIYANWDGSRWNTQNLDVTAYVGGYLALDSNENPRMCYSHDKVFGYVNWNGTSWVYQIIDTKMSMFVGEHLF